MKGGHKGDKKGKREDRKERERSGEGEEMIMGLWGNGGEMKGRVVIIMIDR